VSYLYLTTTGRRSGQPREIEIWFTEHGGAHYLVAEHRERTQWVQNLLADPRVRWRVGDATFTGRARVVDAMADRALSATIQDLSTRKYGWGDGLVVELRACELHPPTPPSPPAKGRRPSNGGGGGRRPKAVEGSG
jgi:deazaflavin-dependent oxidoreductase (nitroreductase family)